jgi:malonate transporter
MGGWEPENAAGNGRRKARNDTGPALAALEGPARRTMREATTIRACCLSSRYFPFLRADRGRLRRRRARILPLDAIPGLNTFVLYFALPCMLLRFGAGTPIGQLLDGSVALVWGVARWRWWRAWCVFTRNARIGWNDAAFGALVAAFPNTGFMGVPLLVALLGAQAAGPMIITIASTWS